MKHHALTQTDFDSLLGWLDPDRQQAGEKYETIRNGLIQIFQYRGCLTPEELADETINRVARRAAEVSKSFEGDPARYFYGVAKKVYLEYVKEKPMIELPASLATPPADDVEQQYQCLDQCIGQLTDGNRTLILQYYRERKRAKIESRRAIRAERDLKPGALRVRVFRIRETLEKCVRRCLELDG